MGRQRRKLATIIGGAPARPPLFGAFAPLMLSRGIHDAAVTREKIALALDRPGSEHDGAAGYYAAEGFDRGGVVLAGRVEAEPLHRGRGAARVEGAAHQVVEGVGRLDDAAAQWRSGGRP